MPPGPSLSSPGGPTRAWRNAIYLAGLGCSVDAVDFSPQAIAEARQRAGQAGCRVNFLCSSIFEAGLADGSYDLVYDSGCFPHLPPHRRKTYTELVRRALKPGGRYGLACFRPEGGSGLTDQQVYEQMGNGNGQGPFLSEDFLWALLAVKDGS